MNRYTIEGIANDLRDGKNVIILGRTWRETDNAFRQATSNEAETIRRTGNEARATYRNGATLDARSISGRGHRGMSADTVVLLGSDDISPDMHASIAPIIATSASGKIIAA